MEAKDTVMSGEEMYDNYYKVRDVAGTARRVAEAQAEASFRAGYKTRQEETCYDCEALNELLRQKTGMGQGEIDSEAEDIKQAKLKEWGIEGENV